MTVAVKRLHQQEFDEAVLEEFKKEVAMMVTLTHPNLVLFMGACPIPGNMQIITEYMCNGDLSTVLGDKSINLSFVQKCKMAKDITNAMMWLHNCKPPVIHRDLKPGNLLVGVNYIVKLCDFGLSVFQVDKYLQDTGSAGGSMLWMSPEVLKGEPFTEKRDVYAFGLVLWELFTGDEPFAEYFDPQEFMNAITIRGERPPLGKLNKNLAKLIDACWAHSPNVRPSMSKVLPWINQIMIEVLPCPKATEMWKLNWPESAEVPFPQFAAGMATHFGEKYDPDAPTVKFQCLRRLICGTVVTNPIVKLERFALVLNWMGAFEVRGQEPWLNRMVTLMSCPWFHGDVERPAAEKNVYSSNKNNSYLVRFSLTDAVRTPFTLSKVSKKNATTITHLRITRAPDGESHWIFAEKNGQQQKIEAQGGLPGLILMAKKALKLENVVQGSPYADLFPMNQDPSKMQSLEQTGPAEEASASESSSF